MPIKNLRRFYTRRHGLRRGLALLAVSLLASGCGQPDQIVRYTVPDPAEVPQTGTDRMLGAILPTENSLLFFKVTGPAEVVAGHYDAFVGLVKSVEFVGGMPVWKLPEKWTQTPGDRMRLATIAIPTPEEPLELTVIPLGLGNGPLEEQVLANVNRWRGQLKLPSITQAQLDGSDQQWERVNVGDSVATVVNFVGELDTSRQPPFAGGPAEPPPQGPQVPVAEPDEFTFDKPASWQAGPATGMRKAAFTVRDGGQQVEITVIPLTPGQSLLPNVNRWRGQINLGEINEPQLEELVQQVPVGESPGHYVQLYGSQESILAVVVERNRRTWFIRLKGATELARRERENFEKFVRSVRWK